MTPPIVIPRFGRVVASLEGKGDISQPVRMVNFLAYAASLKFRYGYTPILSSPVTAGQPFAALGLGYVQNKSGVTEFLSVENHNGSINAYSYSYDPATMVFARSTSLASGLILATSDWVISSYADHAYLINPGGTKSVYRHTIGGTDLVPVEDSGYTDPANPALTISPLPLDQRGNDSTDTYAITLTGSAGINGGITFAEASGVLTISANSFNRVGQHRTTLESAFTAASVDWSKSDYIAFTCNAGVIYINWERTNLAPQIKYGGAWHTLASTEFKEYFSSDNKEVTIVTRIKSLGSNRSAVQGFRVTIGGATANTISGTQTAFTVQPVALGGTYLEATDSVHRLWDGNLDRATIQYGVRYKNGGTYSALIQGSIDDFESYGFYPSTFASPLGGKIALSTPIDTGGAYTNVEFLRQTADGTAWKIIGTVANTGVPQLQDSYEENELAALTTATGISVTNTPAPVFRTAGIVGSFPFKQYMVWLTSGGESNVQMSRVGNAEELYDSRITYDSNDLTQPGQRTLADNADDEPVWGTQAGDTCVIVGKKAAYVMNGNYPVQMSPTRQIAGSRGIIGRFAGMRFRGMQGQYAAAYCDPDFNIWAVEAVPQFQGDGRGHPVELSLPVRGLMKSFLFDEQKLLTSTLNPSQVQLEFDEETSSLWVILGKRAAVLRQDMNEQGWEFFDYSLRSDQGATTVQTETTFTGNGGIATSVPTGDAAWTNLGEAFASDDNYASDDAYAIAGPIPLGIGKKTETLRVTGFTPLSLIPANATLNKIRWEVERSKIGDLTATETKVQPTLSGSPLGSDLGTSFQLTQSDTTQIFEITTGLPTIAQVNSGALGLDLQVTQQDTNPEWNDPTKWTVTVSGGGTSAVMTVTATYSGGIPAPGFVYINISSSVIGSVAAVGGPTSSSFSMNETVNDGFSTNTETISFDGNPDSSIGSITQSDTQRVRISLSAGTGSTTITRSVSGTLLSGLGWIPSATYTGSATFSPFVLDTIKVDNLNFSITYTVDSTNLPGWVGWSQACFTVDGKRLAIRSTGELDLIEKDFRNSAYITGRNRDGGYAPPNAEWWSQNIDYNGLTASLFACQVNTTLPTDSVSVFSKVSNGPWVGSFLAGYPSSRWFRFPLSHTGIHHQFKLTMLETAGGIEGMTFDFRPASKSKTR